MEYFQALTGAVEAAVTAGEGQDEKAVANEERNVGEEEDSSQHAAAVSYRTDATADTGDRAV